MDPPGLDYTALGIILLIYSIYSIVFSMALCWFFYSYPFLITMAGKLILTMAILEIIAYVDTAITSLFYLITGNPLSEEACIPFGFILCFTDIFKNLLVLLIALFCYLEICHNINSIKYFKPAFCVIFLLSALIPAIPFLTSKKPIYQANDKVHCFFSEEQKIFTIICVYILLLLSFLLSLFLMFLSLRKFRESPTYHSNYLMKLFVFPIILFTSYIFGYIRRISHYFYHDYYAVLVYLMYIFFPMHGVFNALFYVYINKFVRERLKLLLTCGGDKQSFLDNEMNESIVVVE